MYWIWYSPHHTHLKKHCFKRETLYYWGTHKWILITTTLNRVIILVNDRLQIPVDYSILMDITLKNIDRAQSHLVNRTERHLQITTDPKSPIVYHIQCLVTYLQLPPICTQSLMWSIAIVSVELCIILRETRDWFNST